MRIPSKRVALLCVAVLGAAALSVTGCNFGPFPDFLERLDPLRPVEGDVKGWILAQDDQSHVLVLSVSGRFLHSIIGRDTSVRLETGSYSVDGNELVMRTELRYVFPVESGPVSGREGAQSERFDDDPIEVRHPAWQQDERLTIEGWGTFVSTSDYVLGLDRGTRAGRGCLLKYIQLSIRTIQARIRNFGGGGTAIYHNNESSFVGFLSGDQSIVVDNLLSPDTTITYDDFQDFPEILLDGSLVSHVNTSGDGTLDESIRFTVFDTSLDGAPSGGGATGLGGQSSFDRIFAEGRLIYGPDDPIRIEQADVVGGSYGLEIDSPVSASDEFSWEFLADLDLRECSVFAGE